MEKNECIKSINNYLEKILDEFIEVLSLLKTKDSTKIEEIEALVFSKKRIIGITENIQRIFQNLVIMKHIHRNSLLGYSPDEPKHGFSYLNEVHSKDFTE